MNILKNQLLDRLEVNPVIAAVNSMEKVTQAIESPCETVFLLKGNIFNLSNIINAFKQVHMTVYVHLDLMEGLSKDLTALRYISEKIKPDGIITTKNSLVKKAKSMHLYTIQRLFLLDSLSLEKGIHSVCETKPDAIEVMPGIMPKIIEKISAASQIPVISGGLISDKEDVIQCLKSGAMGVSTSKRELWYV